MLRPTNLRERERARARERERHTHGAMGKPNEKWERDRLTDWLTERLTDRLGEIEK